MVSVRQLASIRMRRECTTSFCCGGYGESFLGSDIDALALVKFHLFDKNTKRRVCLDAVCSVVFPLNFNDGDLS